jgi:hypothetical protein
MRISQAAAHIPHARKELDKTAITKRESDDDVGVRNVTGPNIDQRQDEGGQGEG